MQRYVRARLALLVPTLLGITLVVSIAVRFLHGNVVDQILASYRRLAAGARPTWRRTTGSTATARERLPERGRRCAARQLRQVADQRPADLTGPSSSGFRSHSSSGAPVLILSLLIALPIGVLAAGGRTRSPTTWRAACDRLHRRAQLLAGATGDHLRVRWFHWTPPLRYESLLKHPAQNVRIMWVPAIILGAGLFRRCDAGAAHHPAGGHAPGLRAYRLGQGAAGAER